jgi:hypothetical protein
LGEILLLSFLVALRAAGLRPNNGTLLVCELYWKKKAKIINKRIFPKFSAMRQRLGFFRFSAYHRSAILSRENFVQTL